MAGRHEAPCFGQVAGTRARRRTARTRSHSLATWRARRRSTGSGIATATPGSTMPEWPEATRGGLALRPPLRVGRAVERRGSLRSGPPRPRHRRASRRAPWTGRRSRSAARSPPGAALTTSWSMIPVGTPVAACSASLAGAGQAHRVGVAPEHQGQGHLEGGARGQSRPDRERRVDGAVPSRGGRTTDATAATYRAQRGSSALEHAGVEGDVDVDVGGLGVVRGAQHHASCRRRARRSPWCRGRRPWAGRRPRCSRCGRR